MLFFKIEAVPYTYAMPSARHITSETNMKVSIYGGEEANELRLLMTTYRQHIMTTFGCVRDKSTVFTHFLGQFSLSIC